MLKTTKESKVTRKEDLMQFEMWLENESNKIGPQFDLGLLADKYIAKHPEPSMICENCQEISCECSEATLSKEAISNYLKKITE